MEQQSSEGDSFKKQDSVCSEGGLNRRKKTPEELAAEAEEANLDDFTSKLTIQLKHDHH